MDDILRVWPIVCQFGVGALLGLVGIWGGMRGGYVNLRNPADRRVIYVLIGGYLGMLALACAFTFWAPDWAPGGAP
ncbi:MAG TPA: hypothetical protein VM492_14365 [Sumerlaeia bacterium]|nr:hypothetical protein [Sumerlaeia bacterium]